MGPDQGTWLVRSWCGGISVAVCFIALDRCGFTHPFVTSPLVAGRPFWLHTLTAEQYKNSPCPSADLSFGPIYSVIIIPSFQPDMSSSNTVRSLLRFYIHTTTPRRSLLQMALAVPTRVYRTILVVDPVFASLSLPERPVSWPCFGGSVLDLTE